MLARQRTTVLSSTVYRIFALFFNILLRAQPPPDFVIVILSSTTELTRAAIFGVFVFVLKSTQKLGIFPLSPTRRKTNRFGRTRTRGCGRRSIHPLVAAMPKIGKRTSVGAESLVFGVGPMHKRAQPLGPVQGMPAFLHFFETLLLALLLGYSPPFLLFC